MNLKSSVNLVPKIGPKYQKLLNKLEIYKVEDLLYHFPFRYEDYSKVSKVSELIPNADVTIKAQIVSAQNIFTKNRKRITKAIALDETGELELIWFNQHYIKKALLIGEEYYISGKVGTFSYKPAIISPQLELVEKGKTLNTGRIVPVYPETKGLTSKWIRDKIDFLLNKIISIEEILPKELLEENNFPTIKAALRNMHFPKILRDAEEAKKRFAFEELLTELLRVEHRKHIWHQKMEGVPLKVDEYKKEIETFENSLPFELTSSQKNAVREIFEEMQGQHPMNRLLEGDVGTGKTVVAVAAAYLAYLNGFKTLYMAPTEILAQQHYKNFIQYLEPFKVKIELKTGSKKTNLNNTEFDIAIGTHALLFTEDALEKVGLVVIDEQHRFGVKQRAKLASLSNETKAPNILTMTATPIPRTLALTLYGDLSISTLDVPPNKDKKITTKVVPDSKRLSAYKWIKSKGEPTFIVCPLIEESEHEMLENVKAAEAEYEKLSKGIFKDISVGLLHGRMKPAEKKEIVDKFRAGEYKVLISTPVIEVGIDIPDATIIVIESAERYGLASLHQLRGRVGRGKKEGFCLLFQSNYSKKAYARLKNLEKINSGLKLAEIDMKYRGQGDVFGTMQSGIKSFKVADIGNLKMIEDTKKAAQKYYPKLHNYPLLEQKIKVSDEVINN
ncbi:MAG: ATP-dependent DNA helicase RecG [Patescibacteria group bacterium]